MELLGEARRRVGWGWGKNFGGHHFVNPLKRFLEDRGFLEGFLEVVLRSRVVTSKPCCCIKLIKYIISIAKASVDLISTDFISIDFISMDFISMGFISIHSISIHFRSNHFSSYHQKICMVCAR